MWGMGTEIARGGIAGVLKWESVFLPLQENGEFAASLLPSHHPASSNAVKPKKASRANAAAAS